MYNRMNLGFDLRGGIRGFIETPPSSNRARKTTGPGNEEVLYAELAMSMRPTSKLRLQDHASSSSCIDASPSHTQAVADWFANGRK
jgi:hypothetical protein